MPTQGRPGEGRSYRCHSELPPQSAVRPSLRAGSKLSAGGASIAASSNRGATPPSRGNSGNRQPATSAALAGAAAHFDRNRNRQSPESAPSATRSPTRYDGQPPQSATRSPMRGYEGQPPQSATRSQARGYEGQPPQSATRSPTRGYEGSRSTGPVAESQGARGGAGARGGEHQAAVEMCRKCGHDLKPNSFGCLQCGTQRPPPTTQVPSLNTCGCGASLTADAAFCMRCGAKRVQPPPTPARRNVGNASARGNTWPPQADNSRGGIADARHSSVPRSTKSSEVQDSPPPLPALPRDWRQGSPNGGTRMARGTPSRYGARAPEQTLLPHHQEQRQKVSPNTRREEDRPGSSGSRDFDPRLPRRVDPYRGSSPSTDSRRSPSPLGQMLRHPREGTASSQGSRRAESPLEPMNYGLRGSSPSRDNRRTASPPDAMHRYQRGGPSASDDPHLPMLHTPDRGKAGLADDVEAKKGSTAGSAWSDDREKTMSLSAVSDFFVHCLEWEEQMKTLRVESVETLKNGMMQPKPVGLHVVVPIRLWRTEVAANAAAAENAAAADTRGRRGNDARGSMDRPVSPQAPVRLVRVPLCSVAGPPGTGAAIVKRCFKPDLEQKVSLQHLAEAPRRLAAALREDWAASAAASSSTTVRTNSKSRNQPPPPPLPTGMKAGRQADDAASTLRRTGNSAGSMTPATAQRFQQAADARGDGENADLSELANLLDQGHGGMVLPQDFAHLVNADEDGFVDLADLVSGTDEDYAAINIASPSCSSPAAASRGFEMKGEVFDPGATLKSTSSAKLPKSMLTGVNPPRFIFAQTLLALGLWLGYAFAATPAAESWLTAVAGLESAFPGRTVLRIHEDCTDLRFEFLWRCLTYQFSHVGLRHVAVNALMNLVLGIPLEEFHGTCRIMVMYNIGVIGGACCTLVSDSHRAVVGMSGGCYALVGMHLADLVMNWHERKHPIMKALLLVVLAAYDILSALFTQSAHISHATHFGGYLAGVVIAIGIGRNIKVTRCERRIRLIVVACGITLAIFCLYWGLATWAPQTIWEDDAWCWSRQVSSRTTFNNDDWHCVRCDSEACISEWSTQQYIAPVSPRSCEQRGGWLVSDR